MMMALVRITRFLNIAKDKVTTFHCSFLVHFNDFIQNCGGTLMHPGGINGDEDLIYQVDADGMLVQTSTDDLIGATTLKQNYRGMVGFCRHPIEQGQGGKLKTGFQSLI